MILLLISFLAGVLTVLAPCTLPLLPVIIGSSVGEPGSKGFNFRKAFTITGALGLSVIIFTLILKASTALINIPQSAWQIISGVIILIFGLISLFPAIWERIPFVAKLNIGANKAIGAGYQKKSFLGDVIIGASLGPVFSTCSPTYFIILATVLPQSFLLGFIDLIAYAAGLSLVLLLVALLGQRIVSRLGGISDTHGWFKRTLGLLFILLAIAILTGFDKKVENSLLKSGFGSTKLEQKLLSLSDDESGIVKGGPYELAPEIVNPSGFINSNGEPITISQYKGKKVVLLDIWTYSCINCQRTIPYLNQWYSKYEDDGLVIIGLHTPEFAFEKLQKNVEAATKELGIKYPVVMDNDYATWNAYGNRYWPRKYLINVNGEIVYDHIGEGGYEDTERAIQMALLQLNEITGSKNVIPTTISKPSDVIETSGGEVKSPEIYFGYARNDNLKNGDPQKSGEQTLVIPKTIAKNSLYLGGTWKFGAEEAKNLSAGKIVFKYDAKNVYMVASSELPDGITVSIKKDGVVQKTLTIKDNKLYTLIQGTDYGEHTLEIDIPEAGLDAFTFTFG